MASAPKKTFVLRPSEPAPTAEKATPPAPQGLTAKQQAALYYARKRRRLAYGGSPNGFDSGFSEGFL